MRTFRLEMKTKTGRWKLVRRGVEFWRNKQCVMMSSGSDDQVSIFASFGAVQRSLAHAIGDKVGWFRLVVEKESS